MSAANPYVVAPSGGHGGPGVLTDLGGPVDNDANSVSWTDGVPVLDGALDSAVALKNGDFVEAGLDMLGGGIDALGVLTDPFGALGSLVAGWIIAHLQPVQDLLDQIAGDPNSIYAEAATWHKVAQAISGISTDYVSAARADTAPMDGLMITAYRGYAELQATVMSGIGEICDGVGEGIKLGGTIVAGVRAFIQQLLTDVIGQIIGKVAESLCTLGIAAPHALASAANKCRQLIEKTKELFEKLSRTLDRMAHLLHDINPKLEAAAKIMSKGAHRASQLNDAHFLQLLTHLSVQSKVPVAGNS